jgi:hypothetical protein
VRLLRVISSLSKKRLNYLVCSTCKSKIRIVRRQSWSKNCTIDVKGGCSNQGQTVDKTASCTADLGADYNTSWKTALRANCLPYYDVYQHLCITHECMAQNLWIFSWSEMVDSMQEKKRGLPWMGLMPCPMPDALKNPVATVLWHPKSWLCQNLPEFNSARAHLPVLYFAPKNLQQNIACPVEERRKRRREPRPSVQGQGVVALFRRIWRRSSRRCWTCKDRNLWKLS